MNIQEFVNNPPKLHKDGAGNLVSWQLSREALYFIDKHVDESAKTLETGAGVSTILFALKYTNHTCIVPKTAEVDRISEYCMQHQLSIQKISFQIGRSENILPGLELNELDLVLIDGRHAFPTPFIDWYYTACGLKEGGILIIDDTDLWTGEILKKFLLSEPEWKLEEDYSHTAVFIKAKEYNHSKGWSSQPYVVHCSSKVKKEAKRRKKARLRSAIGLLCRGKILTLIKKIINNYDYCRWG